MKKTLTASVVLLLAGAAQLIAGAVYVPVASNVVIDSRVFETRVWISNPTNEIREFRILFIPSGIDGTLEDRSELPALQIGPLETLLLSDIVPVGASGMLEIDADPALVLSSEVRPTVGEVPLAAARVPLVSSENLIPAEGMAQLQGLMRTPEGTVSNVGILNLGQSSASCIARVFRATGGPIGGTVILALDPLSHRQFDEVFAILGVAEIRDARAEISCDQDFYTYATVYGVDPEQTLFAQPAVTGASKLRPPGLEPPVVEFSAPGIFLDASEATPFRRIELPAARGESFRRVELEFDFLMRRFNSDLFHTVFSLRSSGLYCELAIRGDNARSFWDTPSQSVRGAGPWRPQGRYHLSVVYDVVEDLAVIEVFEANKLVQRLEAQANRTVLGNLDGSLRLDFSQEKVVDNAFFPLWGSTFSNLKVRLFPLEP